MEVTVQLNGSLLEMEGAIQEATNAVGRRVTQEALQHFDADGNPIRVGEIKLTARAARSEGVPDPLRSGR